MAASETAAFKLGRGLDSRRKDCRHVDRDGSRVAAARQLADISTCRPGTIEGQPYDSPASGVAALRTALNGCQPLPPELDGQLTLGIGPVFPDFLTLKAADNVVLVNNCPAGPTSRSRLFAWRSSTAR